MKPQLLGFHHIAIIASNYARSKHFYMDILGAKQLMMPKYKMSKSQFFS